MKVIDLSVILTDMIRVTIKEAAQRRKVENSSQLAKLMKCDPTIIYRYWEGKQLPGLKMLYRIADALECQPWDLIVRTNGKLRKHKLKQK